MRILLVDDDTSILQTLLPVLRSRSGAEVRGAISAAKALENAEAMGGVDLLISDVMMQPADGFALRDEMERRYPGVRTIFISGYDLSEYEQQTRGYQLLAKPIEIEALHEAIDVPFAEPIESLQRDETADIATERLPVRGDGSDVDAPAFASAVSTLPHSASPSSSAAGSRFSNDGSAHAISADGAEQSDFGENVGDNGRGSAEEAEGNSLVGQTVGSYEIVRKLGEGRLGTAYAAVQVSINRHVGLKILDASRQRDEATKGRFIADARAKAHVQHPAIVSVYEAGEADGHIFYAHEYVEGETLGEIQASGRKIDENTALKILRTIGEGLAYLNTRRIPHSLLEPAKIYLGLDGHPRMANLATHHAERQLTPEQEIQTLGRAVLSVALPVQQLSPGLRTLLGRMVQTGPNTINGWGPLLENVKALEPKVVPLEVAKISAADRAAIEAVEAARRQRKKSLWLTAGTMLLTLAAVVWVVWFYLFRSNERILDKEVDIPAGEYLVGPGAIAVRLPAFSIDRYEVTIGQYAKFLDYLERNPGKENEFNHPRQPRHVTHRPKDWNIYYLRAKAGRPVHGVPTDLNSPVMMVTWWDAYAYAKWRGRDLPTEQQWEAAARGPKGFIYPWGDEFDPKKANSNADFNADTPSAKGEVDGYNFWNPVDALRSDKSPFGVIGMAGNVSEWSATWTQDNRFPVVKGGNYMSADVRLDKRSIEYDPSRAAEHIGFRTVSNATSKTAQ